MKKRISLILFMVLIAYLFYALSKPTEFVLLDDLTIINMKDSSINEVYLVLNQSYLFSNFKNELEKFNNSNERNPDFVSHSRLFLKEHDCSIGFGLWIDKLDYQEVGFSREDINDIDFLAQSYWYKDSRNNIKFKTKYYQGSIWHY